MTKQVLDFRFKKVVKDDDFFSEMVGRDEGIREREREVTELAILSLSALLLPSHGI